MSKNNLGKAAAFMAGAVAAAAGIAYFAKYKSFHKELEKDFRDFEADDFDGNFEDEDSSVDLNNPAHRNYVSLSSSKDEFKAAAKDVKESVGVAAGAAKDVLKDTAAVLKDTAHSAVSVAVDTAHIATAAVKETIGSYKEKHSGDSESESQNDFAGSDSIEKAAAEAAEQIAEAADAFAEQMDKASGKPEDEAEKTTMVEEITE
mgnify:FL=1